MAESNNHIATVIKAYDSRIVKAYCWGRFKILRLSFLEEIGQYLPASGTVLDIGCGFGLFSLYYAKRFPDLNILGIDHNPKRIKMARHAAEKLGLTNVRYETGDAVSLSVDDSLDGAYMLDIIHHIPWDAVQNMLKQLHTRLKPEGILIVKDVNVRPAYKRWFTLIMDKLMDLKGRVHYWDQYDLMKLFHQTGFQTHYHSMVDILPYPHILYICRKNKEA